MFGNNKVINNIYNKMNQYAELKQETYAKRANVYFMAFMLSGAAAIYITTTNVLGSVALTGILLMILIPIIAFSGIFATHTDIIDPGSFFWPTSNKFLNAQRKEIIDYIAKEETQIEILNFKFGSLSEATVNEFKKSLALKEYSDAYTKLCGMLNSMVHIEQTQLTESQTKKLIAEYELGLKMKL